MTNRIIAALALAAALGFGATRAAADDPKLPDTKTFDKLVVDTLRDVHNKGADLYNASKDYTGAYRLYEGALATVRPLLAHRPDAQKIIDAGLSAAEKESEAARKAFLLHEAIEGVRKNLKTAIAEPKKSVEPPKKPEDKKPDDKKTVEPPKKVEEPPKKPVEPPKKTEEPKKTTEPPKKVDDKKPVEPPKKVDEKKPDEPKKSVEPPKKPVEPPKKVEEKKPDEKKPDGVAVAPMPKDGKAKAAMAASVGGKITLAGKPLAEGEVTFVSLNQPTPRTFTAAVKSGDYKFAEAIPPGSYAGMVTGKDVPAKYHTIGTAGLKFEFAAGANTADLLLK